MGARNWSTRKPALACPAATLNAIVPDHLGSVRVSIDAQGNLTQLDYRPFGEIDSVRQFGSHIPRQKFIDKETDAESALGDFGVRKYEAETGRFLSVDALWEKYRWLSPYQYASNSPLYYKDGVGTFYVLIHGDITSTALAGIMSPQQIGVMISGNQAKDTPKELGGKYRSADHMDNSDFAEGWETVNSAMGSADLLNLGAALHTLQDFYSHSNYVELATAYFGSEGAVPTFDRAQCDPAFMDLWAEEGRSGVFPEGRTGGPKHSELNKDEPDRRGYRLARRLAIAHTRRYVVDWLIERRNVDADR